MEKNNWFLIFHEGPDTSVQMTFFGSLRVPLTLLLPFTAAGVGTLYRYFFGEFDFGESQLCAG